MVQIAGWAITGKNHPCTMLWCWKGLSVYSVVGLYSEYSDTWLIAFHLTFSTESNKKVVQLIVIQSGAWLTSRNTHNRKQYLQVVQMSKAVENSRWQSCHIIAIKISMHISREYAFVIFSSTMLHRCLSPYKDHYRFQDQSKVRGNTDGLLNI